MHSHGYQDLISCTHTQMSPAAVKSVKEEMSWYFLFLSPVLAHAKMSTCNSSYIDTSLGISLSQQEKIQTTHYLLRLASICKIDQIKNSSEVNLTGKYTSIDKIEAPGNSCKIPVLAVG